MHNNGTLFGTKQLDYPTEEYGTFQEAFDYFNGRLFGGALPPCLITLQRKAHSRGSYWAKKYETRDLTAETDEIALNPATFKDRDDKDILSTLVHEQVHLWQQHFGRPGRGRYHNREWAAHMESVGLMPSSTGMPGGKRTGQRMSHYVISGGPFDRAADALLTTGFRLTWQSREAPKNGTERKSKVKYTCATCGQNAWAKPAAKLACAACQINVALMLSEQEMSGLDGTIQRNNYDERVMTDA